MAKPQTGAGAAYRKLLDTDPATKAAWKRAQPALKRRLRELAADWPARTQAWEDALGTRHFDAPKTIEEWERLASIVEIPRRDIGDLTAREIHDQALEWADLCIRRESIRAKLKADDG